MKTFTYESELYIRIIPAKSLFRSTLVHEVVNRGDIFAIRVSDSTLTVIPGTAQVIHHEHNLAPAANKATATRADSKAKTEARAKLREIADELRETIRNKQTGQRPLFGNS